MAKTLQTVTDKFSLFNDGRKLGANKRNYILNAVKDMINAPKTQELLRLGEAYGFYGHQSRQRANKLDIGETEVININGKPVIVENVPACRTVAINVDDQGIVTHTQEILDTPTGRIVDSMVGTAGGWSWATGGKDTREASITRSYHGMDYVLQPNFISLNHPAMMLESMQDREAMMLESLTKNGLDIDSAEQALAYLKANQVDQDSIIELERENLILESMLSEKDKNILELRAQLDSKAGGVDMLLEALSTMPIYISDEQRNALKRMETNQDKKIIQAMFESLSDMKLRSLPLGGSKSEILVKDLPRAEQGDYLDLRQNVVRRFN